MVRKVLTTADPAGRANTMLIFKLVGKLQSLESRTHIKQGV